MVLKNVTMILFDRIFKGDIRIKGSHISEIEENLVENEKEEVLDLEGKLLIPGFIDVHIHGADGADAMDGSIESLQKISKYLASKGTTNFLATTLTSSKEMLKKVLSCIGEVQNQEMEGANIFGAHMEGPYFDVEYKGAQNEKYIKMAGMEEIQEYLSVKKDLVKLFALSPNSNNLDIIRYLVKEGVIVSVGHSAASFEQVMAAVEAGLSHATHTFNGMKGFTHRDPGVVGAVLDSDEITAEVIFDKIHVHPEAVRVLIKTKGVEKVVCITDSMSATGLPCGRYKLGELDVNVVDNQARLSSNGALAGSVLTMDKAFRHLLELGYNLMDAVKLTSTNVAKEFRLNTGMIRVGKDADLVVLDEKHEVKMTIVKGKIKYSVL
ncbi:N-acetylglucosamine-6-phosphate deacetylase [Fusobacterium necrophorum subsp. funduliforme ATCC 51357]|uniref:N-acetylglucosamine-6-phosphate deacetylase n=1 Tax=Fusobacterium necrophorum subsp. funduliforme TaxID=143387 RepID=A0A162JDW9_9FUSO|nr:N-acetylglucosamine-6-phosphate deacetylase [Fusobacterium necrophorum]AYV93145.1 N-acetylglucosamine-6-phosphate deacetylase [Fusobacterium necrophorum subsp. funduliforme]EIJ68289.1 N-acetylglucosamine-6-phosphate deacetylase [Fusobacterium necrophorum subsp. funduliforme ATCC 51357]KAB0554282.1 N-acetylglucosamine-6-phosphate deacetylase [Fusobacterium necrophorum subsp. funduliforme]KYL05601.1 N-acetylglucosamine-6-phosphate deacetylase [Fusobacterium necrophorum subsp. funduliforme]KYM